MAAATLDTHRIVKRLQGAGASEPLAETWTDILREARELDLSQLATKADLAGEIANVRREIAEAKADIIKWMVGVGLAQALALIGALFAFLRFLPGGAP